MNSENSGGPAQINSARIGMATAALASVAVVVAVAITPSDYSRFDPDGEGRTVAGRLDFRSGLSAREADARAALLMREVQGCQGSPAPGHERARVVCRSR